MKTTIAGEEYELVEVVPLARGAQVIARRINHAGSKIQPRPSFPFLPNGQPTQIAGLAM